MFRKFILSLAFVSLFSATANATTVDFGSGAFSTPNLTFSSRAFNLGDVTVTLAASGAVLPYLEWNAGDGFGINQLLNLLEQGDEVNYPEVLTLSFSSAVLLNSFTVANFFTEGLFPYAEQGSYSINGGASQSFSALNPGGLLTVNTAGAAVTTIAFTAPHGGLFANHDYSLKALDYNASAVPEPASLLLLSSALFGVAPFARRRRA